MYIMNDDQDLIYEVRIDTRDIQIKDKNSYIVIKLDLVCGKDWVEVNSYGGREGWIPPEWFTDEVQLENVVCYFFTESVEECLIDNGYTIVSKLPKIEQPKE